MDNHLLDTQLLDDLQREEETARRCFVDIMDYASRFQRNYGHYLRPYTGRQLYSTHRAKPIIDFDKHKYHSFRNLDPLDPNSEQVEVPVTKIEEIITKVYAEDESLVVDPGQPGTFTRLLVVPHYPIREMDLITEYITEYAKGRIPAFESTARSFEDILDGYLDDAFKLRIAEMRATSEDEVRSFYDEAQLCLAPMMSRIRTFMGDNPWIIYSVDRTSIEDVLVTRYVDYRIYVYHKRLKDEQEARLEAQRQDDLIHAKPEIDRAEAERAALQDEAYQLFGKRV
jgi:hypothetical protein